MRRPVVESQLWNQQNVPLVSWPFVLKWVKSEYNHTLKSDHKELRIQASKEELIMKSNETYKNLDEEIIPTKFPTHLAHPMMMIHNYLNCL